jgi:hypothetical protein
MIAVMALACAGPALAQDAAQWRVENGGNGHWYAELNQERVWPDANNEAEELGATLVTVTSLAEFQFLVSDSGLDISHRFGGAFQDLEAADYDEPYGGWRWVTGEAFDWNVMNAFMNADDCPGGSPGACGCGPSGMQNSLLVCCVGGVLDDVGDGLIGGCDSIPRKSVIEWSADCNGDGVTDACEILAGAIDTNPADGIPDSCQGLTRGACCIDGVCVQLPADECFNAQGAYAGNNIDCYTANCPTNCIGDLLPDGVVDINDVLIVLGSWGACP